MVPHLVSFSLATNNSNVCTCTCCLLTAAGGLPCPASVLCPMSSHSKTQAETAPPVWVCHYHGRGNRARGGRHMRTDATPLKVSAELAHSCFHSYSVGPAKACSQVPCWAGSTLHVQGGAERYMTKGRDIYISAIVCRSWEQSYHPILPQYLNNMRR